MNHYEEKQEARRQRYLGYAVNANKEADRRHSVAESMASCIPFGQPILIGHHSEQRDRNFRAKIQNNFKKAFEAQEKADYYRDKADSVGTSGISSDDPDAITKLKKKLSDLERSQAIMKAVNVCIRKKDVQRLLDLGLTQEQIQKLMEPDFAGRIGFASYSLANNNANIRAAKRRIKELEAAARLEDKEKEFDGFTYREADNRAQFIFPGKPDDGIRSVLKANAFKWSPTRGAWVRMLNGNGKYAAKRVIEKITAK